jgi:type II secretory pathway pseudopilin PulG
MSLISKALEDYKLDMGTYPPTSNSATGVGNTRELYTALFYEGYDYAKAGSPASWVKTVGSNSSFPKATKIYLPDLDPTAGKQGWVDAVTGANPVPPPTAKIKDPWGTEYAYRTAVDPSGNTNPDTQNPDFDLWSFGKNAKSNISKTHKDSLDDIWNP